MKKNKKRAIAILIVAVMVIFLGQPLSFDPLMEDSVGISVTYIDMTLDKTLDNNGLDARNKTYNFRPEDKGFAQVQEILSRYSYHRAPIIRLLGALGTKNDIGYQLVLSFDCEGKELQPVALTGSRLIYINYDGYLMSRSQVISLMEELRQFIGEENLP